MTNTNTDTYHTIAHRPPNEQKSSRKMIETKSTFDQDITELECRPYFVNLAKLPPSQLDSLLTAGLLQRYITRPEYDDKPKIVEECYALDSQSESGRYIFPFKLALLRSKHILYVSQIWSTLNGNNAPLLKSSFVSLDASQTWMMYWCLHSCDLLSHDLSSAEKEAILESLMYCWSDQEIVIPDDKKQSTLRLLRWANSERYKEKSENIKLGSTSSKGIAGGFAGGPGQLPHIATTYAAVLVLCILSTSTSTRKGENPSDCSKEESSRTKRPSEFHDRARTYLASVRGRLALWLSSLQQSSGSFRMHDDGEVDVRATYCVAVVASLLHFPYFFMDRLAACRFVAACQTYEGGFGGEPFSEAHGGYTFCSLAALYLLVGDPASEFGSGLTSDLISWIDASNLLSWLCRRQMEYEGGFQGRTNKLVDGCYSFWVGSALALVSRLTIAIQEFNAEDRRLDGLDETDTQTQPLFDSAMLERYILLCAQDVAGGLRDKPSKVRDFYHSCYNLSGLSIAQLSGIHYGHEERSKVSQTHPLYNIQVDRVQQIKSYFQHYDAS